MFIVQTIQDNILDEIIYVGMQRAEAEQQFLGACANVISNWLEEYTPADIEAILDQGYEKFGNGAVMLIDTDGYTSDSKLREILNGEPAGDVTVAEIASDGELAITKGMSIDKVLELCGNNLDACNSWDIQGQILFKGSDGEWYTITTESTVSLANPEWVKEFLEESKSE